MQPYDRRYDVSDIRVLEFGDAVRRSPGMYFGVALDSAQLPTRVFGQVVGHSLHPATRVAPMHSLCVEAEIHGGLVFSVADDAADALDAAGTPRLGYFDSLIGPDRWSSGAAAVLSRRVVVEVWRGGRGFRQELAGCRPAGEPEECAAPSAGAGTRMRFELDGACLAPGAAITADLASLELHGRCEEPEGPGGLVLRDLR